MTSKFAETEKKLTETRMSQMERKIEKTMKMLADLDVSGDDTKEANRKLVKDQIAPQIPMLKDGAARSNGILFIEYYNALTSVLEAHDCGQVKVLFEANKSDSCKGSTEAIANEAIRSTIDSAVYARLRRHYLRMKGEYPTAVGLLHMLRDRYWGLKYTSESFMNVLDDVKYDDYRKPVIDYFDIIDNITTAMKWCGCYHGDTDILAHLRPGVAESIKGNCSEFDEINDLVEFKKWIERKVKSKRNAAIVSKSLSKSIFVTSNKQGYSSISKNKKRHEPPNNNRSHGSDHQKKDQSNKGKKNERKENVNNVKLSDESTNISELQVLGSVPMDSLNTPRHSRFYLN